MKQIILTVIVALFSLSACEKAEAEKHPCPVNCCCKLEYGVPHLEEGPKCHAEEVMVGWEEEKALCSKLTLKCGVCPVKP